MSHAHPAERDHLVFDQQSQTLLLPVSYGTTGVLVGFNLAASNSARPGP
jgi:hypothetical protein